MSFQGRLRGPRGRLTAGQKSAEGIVGQAAGKASEALAAERRSKQIGRAETMTEGPNDRERQVGLVTHEWKAAEAPVCAGLGTEGPG